MTRRIVGALVAVAMVAAVLGWWWSRRPLRVGTVARAPVGSIHRHVEVTGDGPPPVGLPPWATLLPTMPPEASDYSR